VHRDDAIKFIGKLARSDAKPYDLAFADPPWRTELARSAANLWIERPFARIFGVEHESTTELPAAQDVRRYGDTAVTFYRCQP
jgi:16S rRNA (guanine966-N2)-methyltransferase